MICGYLKKEEIEIYYFVNNDVKMWKKFCGAEIISPEKIWNEEYYIIVAMPQLKYDNEVLWQLKVHKCSQYGIAFMETFHVFDLMLLQDIVMKVLNQILCNDKEMWELIYPVLNVGSEPKMFFL